MFDLGSFCQDNRIRTEAEAREKEKALVDKIEAGRQLLETRKKQEELLALQQKQEELARSLRGSQGGRGRDSRAARDDDGAELGADDESQENAAHRMSSVVQALASNERLLKLLAEQLGLPVARIAMAADEPAKPDETQLASPSAKGAGGGGSPSKKVEGSDLPPDVVVPQLKLEIAVPVEGQGWRSLQREPIASFFARATRAHTQGGCDSVVNTVSRAKTVDMVDPVDGVRYKMQAFGMSGESFLFIPDPLADTVRVLEMARLQQERQERMAGGGALTQLALGADMSSAEKLLVQNKDPDAIDVKARLEAQACLCAKTGNLEGVEDALDQDVFIDVKDEHGNTLLLLAAQQGSKRIVKSLLRRGANIHSQNEQGNSVLHYCYEYGHVALAEYLQSKGADDSLLNKEGLTCYEGLKQQD